MKAAGYAVFECSGQDSGLRDVEAADRLYCVKGYFQRSRSDDRLRVDAIRGRRLYVDVIDDDEDPCPALYDTGTSSEWGYPADDPIAKSEPFSGDALAGSFGLALTFGDVSRIVLGTAAG